MMTGFRKVAIVALLGLGTIISTFNPTLAESVEGGSKMNLTTALEEAQKKSASRIPEEKKEIMTTAIEELRSNGIVKNVLDKGDEIPMFSLPSAGGGALSIQKVLEKGPAVIVFYRGGWCPYCNLNLHYLQLKLDDIKKAGATLVAISPEKPDNSLSTKEKNALEFPVLSDEGNGVAKQFGLVFTLPERLVSVYKEFGIDLEKQNGDGSHQLPLAGTFIVGSDGKIVERFVDEDYKKRMDPEQIVEVLKLNRK